MPKETKKIAAKRARDFYLYSYCSKEENLVRYFVWAASWLVGIVAPSAASRQALGGAYLIFSLSLLLEFTPQHKRYRLGKIAHAGFCFLLSIMFSGSLLLIFGSIPDEQAEVPLYYRLLVEPLPRLGWAIFIVITIGTVLALAEVHKYGCDEEAETKREQEAVREAVRKLFLDHVKVSPEEGDTE